MICAFLLLRISVTGLPETVRAQLQQLAATSSSDTDSDTDDVLTTSVHQSSVEVHSDYGNQPPRTTAAFEVLDETSSCNCADDEVDMATAAGTTQSMEISEDHFPSELNSSSEVLDPLGVARPEDGQSAAEDETNEASVQVVPPGGRRKKRQRRRNHNENV